MDALALRWGMTRTLEISVTHDVPALVLAFNGLMREQIPFATAVALTRTGVAARNAIRQDLPKHFTIRRPWVANGIILVSAKKKDWPNQKAIVASRDDFMRRQEFGGKKTARGSGVVAIPLAARASKSDPTPPSKWPGRVLRKRGYFVATIKTGQAAGKQAVFHRTGKERYPLEVLYLLVKSVEVPIRWDFRKRVEGVAQREYETQFVTALGAAIR